MQDLIKKIGTLKLGDFEIHKLALALESAAEIASALTDVGYKCQINGVSTYQNSYHQICISLLSFTEVKIECVGEGSYSNF